MQEIDFQIDEFMVYCETNDSNYPAAQKLINDNLDNAKNTEFNMAAQFASNNNGIR